MEEAYVSATLQKYLQNSFAIVCLSEMYELFTRNVLHTSLLSLVLRKINIFTDFHVIFFVYVRKTVPQNTTVYFFASGYYRRCDRPCTPYDIHDPEVGNGSFLLYNLSNLNKDFKKTFSKPPVTNSMFPWYRYRT